MNFTYKNHLKYYIGDKLFGYRTHWMQNYRIEIGQIDHDYYRKNNFSKELKRVADLVYSELGKELVLFFSGGTDSEIILRSLLSIGVTPRCYTVRFKHGFNSHEVNTARSIATKLNVPLTVIDFDLKDFLYSGHAIELGKSIQCIDIVFLVLYKCLLDINLPAIFGGEVILKRNIYTDPSTWNYCWKEDSCTAAIRFTNMYGIPLINEWFNYTPELILYYLESDIVKNLVSDRFNFKLSVSSSKNLILTSLVPEIELRKKTHGYEDLVAFHYESLTILDNEQTLKLDMDSGGIEYNQLIKMLRGI